LGIGAKKMKYGITEQFERSTEVIILMYRGGREKW
jgi:hypothetical protein